MSNTNTLKSLLDGLFDQLFPLCRSITGPGLEASLALIQQHLPLHIEKIPSNSQVFDWTTPPEWHFERARLWGPDGRLICDTEQSNLHVVNYSEPVSKTLPLAELEQHLHSLPEYPHAIPYVTSYYKRTWGFCLPHRERQTLKEGDYRVEIKSSFKEDGGVPFGHCLLPGESQKEILLSSYLCHPSLANNELSGPLVLVALYQLLKAWPRRRFSYRFLLNPETIGSLCFLSRYQDHLRQHLAAGLILTCMGGPNKGLRYKRSRMNAGLIDQLMDHYCARPNSDWTQIPFTPLNGSDERQYCSPGFNFPMGQLCRTSYGQYEGYHNSLDDKAFMDMEQVWQSALAVERLLKDAEISGNPVNLSPYGEPHLGRHGLYPNMNAPSTRAHSNDLQMDGRRQLNATLRLLNLADGKHSLLDMLPLLNEDLETMRPLIELLEEKQLLAYNRDFPE